MIWWTYTIINIRVRKFSQAICKIIFSLNRFHIFLAVRDELIGNPDMSFVAIRLHSVHDWQSYSWQHCRPCDNDATSNVCAQKYSNRQPVCWKSIVVSRYYRPIINKHKKPGQFSNIKCFEINNTAHMSPLEWRWITVDLYWPFSYVRINNSQESIASNT